MSRAAARCALRQYHSLHQEFVVHAEPHATDVLRAHRTRVALVVDDEDSLRLVLRRFLERRHWTVIEARNGEEALRTLAEARQAPDAVIMDFHMPGLSGGALCARIAAEHPGLADRLIIASGDEDAARRSLAKELVDCPVLAKPFELSQLATALDLMLAS